MLGALADAISRRPRRLLVLVLLFAAVAGVVGGPVPGVLVDSTTSFEDPSSESVQARHLLERASGVDDAPDVVLLIRNATPARIAAARSALAGDPVVAAVSPGVRSRDGRSAYVAATFRAGRDDSLVTGLGLGLAIDYSLFILSRYREELARLGPGPAALRRTLETAGRTVLFSGLTVAAALASLCVFPLRFLYSMGVSGAIGALIAVGVSLVGLPAALAALGPRVNALSPGPLRRAAERSALPDSRGAWYRLSHAVMRRPLSIAAASATVLIALGLPFLHIRFTGVDASSLPPSASARQVDEALRAEFPPAPTAPVVVAVRAPAEAETRPAAPRDRKSTRLNSSHQIISYAVFCLNKK